MNNKILPWAEKGKGENLTFLSYFSYEKLTCVFLCCFLPSTGDMRLFFSKSLSFGWFLERLRRLLILMLGSSRRAVPTSLVSTITMFCWKIYGKWSYELMRKNLDFRFHMTKKSKAHFYKITVFSSGIEDSSKDPCRNRRHAGDLLPPNKKEGVVNNDNIARTKCSPNLHL